jgi:hypothetical protein
VRNFGNFDNLAIFAQMGHCPIQDRSVASDRRARLAEIRKGGGSTAALKH